MIKISNSVVVAKAREVSVQAKCPNSFRCLWGDPLRVCPKGPGVCPVPGFRKDLEYESPGFMGFWYQISRYRACIHDWKSMELEGNAEQKKRSREQYSDMLSFKNGALLALGCFVSAHGRVPRIDLDFIERVMEDYSMGMTIKELWERNNYLSRFLQAYPFFEFEGDYKFFLYMLIDIFSAAIDLEGVVQSLLSQERAEFFGKIEEYLRIRR